MRTTDASVQINWTGTALSYRLWRGRQSIQTGSALDASDSLSRVSLKGILCMAGSDVRPNYGLIGKGCNRDRLCGLYSVNLTVPSLVICEWLIMLSSVRVEPKETLIMFGLCSHFLISVYCSAELISLN